MRWSVACLAALVATTAPAAFAAKPAPDAATANDAATLPDGFKLKKGDILVHKASGTEFPKELDGFTRVLEAPYDLQGHDVVIAYRRELNGKPVIARIALIHIEGMTPKEHYLGLKQLVGSYFRTVQFKDIRPGGEGPFDPPDMKSGSGYQGRFRATKVDDGTPYELSLSTVSYGYWSARLTAAYPAEGAPASRAGILALATALETTGPAKKATRHHHH